MAVQIWHAILVTDGTIELLRYHHAAETEFKLASILSGSIAFAIIMAADHFFRIELKWC